MPAYYNEWEPYAADWLRNLIAAGLIPTGDVDERSVTEVSPDDLTGYDQCHFFAGIGGWPLALRLAGYPDDCPVWTASLPCQPFSVAGQGAGTTDARHLWPAFFALVKRCRPVVMFGEQVASALAIGAAGQGQRIPASLSTETSWPEPDSACREAGEEEGTTLRPTRSCQRDRGPRCSRGVRGERTSPELHGRADMGQPLIGSDPTGPGVCVLEHQGCLPCGEQCLWELGRRETLGDCRFDHGAAAERLQSALRVHRETFDRAVGGNWFSGVCADLEEAGYSIGACVLPAAGLEAPHIRQRLFWVADTEGEQRNGSGRARGGRAEPANRRGLADAERDTRESGRLAVDSGERTPTPRSGAHAELGRRGDAGGLGDADGAGLSERADDRGTRRSAVGAFQRQGTLGAGPWADAVWLPCLDGKARRLEPGLEPLVDGIPFRLADGRTVKTASRPALLRGLGNAIVPAVAAEFVRAYLEVRGTTGDAA